MHFKKKFFQAAALITFGTLLSAHAQFNQFAGVRNLVVTPAKMLGSGSDSNSIVDIHGLEGVALLTLGAATNGAVTTTVWIYTSPDKTNYTALNNYALATNTAIITTNNYYGTGSPTLTNTWLLPGALTAPAAASAGFTPPYLVTQPFTNSSANGFVVNGTLAIGFNVQDAGRYLQVLWSNSAAGPNAVFSTLSAGKQAGPY